MGQVSYGVSGMHNWLEWDMLKKGRAEISFWELAKDARLGALSLQYGCLLRRFNRQRCSVGLAWPGTVLPDADCALSSTHDD